MSTAIPEFYFGQDARIDFSCVDETGAPLDLTGGKVEVVLERTGITPFFLKVDTDIPTNVEWNERDKGTGIIIVPLAEENLPIGMIKLMLRSITVSGRSDIQYLSWAKVIRIPEILS